LTNNKREVVMNNKCGSFPKCNGGEGCSDCDIGVETSWGTVEPFTDNSIPICARCGCKLTDENRSKWSDVVGENKTQFICRECEK